MQDLLPSLLGKLAAQNGNAQSLMPIWTEVAGLPAAKSSRPHSLIGGRLMIQVAHKKWLEELIGQRQELMERLRARLGPQSVRDIWFEMVPAW